jgi:TonB-linked SusC/RagA family outer membrane protein
MKKNRMKLCHNGYSWEKTLRIMKLSLALMIFFGLTLSAEITEGQNQSVTLKVKDVTILEVFRKLEEASNFGFFFKNDQLDLKKRYSLNVKDVSLEEILKKVLDENGYEYQIVGENVVVTRKEVKGKAFQQKQKVTGTVTDQNGASIPGVSVVVKGTTTGTITDVEGHYELVNVPEATTLVFSFIGMKTQEHIADGGVINVQMEEDVIGLDEVVAIGYGVQKKSDITGSVTSVSKERLSGKLPVANVMQAVQGSVPGVTITQASSIPGDEPSTMIRGQNSINADTSPYVVVDGIPISKTGGSINDINPNDIESIEILKDASAVAIYGTNGANGVILVTTKKGSLEEPTIRYNTYIGFDRIGHELTPRAGAQYVQKYADFIVQHPEEASGYAVPNLYEVDNYEAGKETDWIDAVSRTGFIQNHNINLSGGAKNVKYFVSGDYLDQKGVLEGYQYKRYSFRTNIDVNATKYLAFGTRSYITAHNKDGGRANLLVASAMSPYASVDEDDGSLRIYPMFPEQLFANPLLNTTTDHERRSFNVNINGYTEIDFEKIWTPLKGLKYKLNAGYTFRPEREASYSGEAANDLIGTGKIENKDTQSYIVENIVSYSRDIQRHHFDFTGLYSSQWRKYKYTLAKAEDFVNDNLGFNDLGSGATATVDSKAERYAAISQMGRLNYSYDSRYLFTFTVRRDGSSVFGSNTSKYGVFPSAAIGWNIHNENFVNIDWLSNLKLRSSYGKSGNEAIDVYQTISTLASRKVVFDGSGVIALTADVLGNSDLEWETTKSFNVGLDFGVFNNRLSGTIDVYKSKTSGILLKRNLPDITGYDNVFANIGKTENRGVELTLSSYNISKRDFKWQTTISYSRNKNEIRDLYGDGQDDVGNNWFLGHPIGVIYDYVKEGIWQEEEIENGDHLNIDPTAKAGYYKLKDVDGNHIINADGDKQILGQTSPKWIGGITNVITYKNVSMNIFIQTVQGAMKYNNDLNYADEAGRRNTPQEVGYWTPENRSNEWRSLNKNSNPHGYGNPKKADYTRLKDVTLSYTFGKATAAKLGVGDLSLYLSGRNLYTWTDWIGWDPEARMYQRGHGDDLGSSDDNYPFVRSFVFGINLTF